MKSICLIVLVCLTTRLLSQDSNSFKLYNPDYKDYSEPRDVVKIPKPNSNGNSVKKKYTEGEYLKAYRQCKIDSNFRLGEGDTIFWKQGWFNYRYVIDSVIYTVDSWGIFEKWGKNTSEAFFDFEVNNLFFIEYAHCFIKDDNIVFILSLTEDFEKKTMIVSLDKENLLNVRSKTFNYFRFNEVSLNGDLLKFSFNESDIVIDLNNDLKQNYLEQEKKSIELYKEWKKNENKSFK